MKRCYTCKLEKPLSEFCKNRANKDGISCYCRQCSTERTRKWRRSPEGVAAVKAATIRHKEKEHYRHFKRKYGLTRGAYDALVASGHCDICGNPFSNRKGRGREPQIDHDHVTGKVRGALCIHCNWMIGHAREKSAILREAQIT